MAAGCIESANVVGMIGIIHINRAFLGSRFVGPQNHMTQALRFYGGDGEG